MLISLWWFIFYSLHESIIVMKRSGSHFDNHHFLFLCPILDFVVGYPNSYCSYDELISLYMTSKKSLPQFSGQSKLFSQYNYYLFKHLWLRLDGL